MIDKGRIKVVKKLEVKKVMPRVNAVKSSRTAAREMVSTVTEWVAELKLRKSGETKAALDLLFGTNSRPSES